MLFFLDISSWLYLCQISVLIWFFPEKQGLGLKSCSLPEFSNLESNDFIADQLCLRDHRRCTLLKLFVSELVSSKSALIFFRCEKIGIQRYFRKKQLWFRKNQHQNSADFFRSGLKDSQSRTALKQRCSENFKFCTVLIQYWFSAEQLCLFMNKFWTALIFHETSTRGRQQIDEIQQQSINQIKRS